jgi:hypothetical protein
MSRFLLLSDSCGFVDVGRSHWRVCRLQLLLALTSAVIFGSESRGTHDHILLSQIRDFPFCRLPRLAGLPRLHTGWTILESESESYVTTDGEPASLSWNKAPICGLRPDLYYCLTVAGLLIWGALSEERPGLSSTIAVSPHQRSHFRVRVPWNSRPYFSVSDSRLPFSSPPAQGYGGGIRPRLHRVEPFSYPLSRKWHLCFAGNVCLRCCENNAYRADAQQPTVSAGRPGYVYQQPLPMQWMHMSHYVPYVYPYCLQIPDANGPNLLRQADFFCCLLLALRAVVRTHSFSMFRPPYCRMSFDRIWYRNLTINLDGPK